VHGGTHRPVLRLHRTLQPRVAAEQRAFEALLSEQRRTNRLLRALVYAAAGVLLGLLAALAVVRWT